MAAAVVDHPTSASADPPADDADAKSAPALAASELQTSQSPEPGAGEATIDAKGDSWPSGNPDDPFGPTSDAPFGFYRDPKSENYGQPKPSGRGRPPNHGPRDVRPDGSAASDAARLASVGRAAPRKPVKPAVATAIAIDYESVAQGFAALWFTTGVLVLGADWEPNTEQREHIAVKDAFKRYCEARKIGDLPPGLALAVCLTTYSLVRLGKPEVKTRLQGISSSISKGYQWLRSKIPFGRSSM